MCYPRNLMSNEQHPWLLAPEVEGVYNAEAGSISYICVKMVGKTFKRDTSLISLCSAHKINFEAQVSSKRKIAWNLMKQRQFASNLIKRLAWPCFPSVNTFSECYETPSFIRRWNTVFHKAVEIIEKENKVFQCLEGFVKNNLFCFKWCFYFKK